MFRLLIWAVRLVIAAVLLSVAWVALYSVLDPPITWLMARDYLSGRHVERSWQPLPRISRNLPRALIGAEDARFCEHRGFDLDAIEKAAKANEVGKRLRGGSTISQQTAKNVFLWPGRSWVRKGFEAWFTFLIETLWGKRRIMEVYLNVIEWGRGIYGAEAASRAAFGHGTATLSPAEAARLAAIVPQPIKRSAAAPSRYTRKYARNIGKRIGTVRADALDDCVYP
ncbi:MAG: monofunctional biosynthetic peptidoglycan transglycosylase [Sphingomonadaceae bacterium]|nr:monofunctional biosynthetic peptidoglycan transglycosylase [Sphingomonadaceae bacterium]